MSTLARYDTWIRSVIGPAAAGAQVFICGQPCAVSTTPTPQVQLYADNAGVTPIAQPLIADGFGHAFCYVASGTYTIVVVYGGSLVLSYVDQSITVGSGNSGNFVTGLPSITTAPAGDIITADGLGNVQDSGISVVNPNFLGNTITKNLDSVLNIDLGNPQGWSGADFGAWVNTAIAALPANGGTIRVGAGTFSFTTPIVIGKANVTIEGAGSGFNSTVAATVLQWTGGASDAITIAARTCTLRNFGMDNTGTGTRAIANNGTYVFFTLLEQISIFPQTPFSIAGIATLPTTTVNAWITLRNCWVESAAPVGIEIDNANLVNLDNVTAFSNVINYRFGATKLSTALFIRACDSELYHVNGNSAIGWDFVNVGTASLIECYAECNEDTIAGTEGQLVVRVGANANFLRIEGNYFAGDVHTNYAVKMNGASIITTFKNNTFSNFILSGINNTTGTATLMELAQNSLPGITPSIITSLVGVQSYLDTYGNQTYSGNLTLGGDIFGDGSHTLVIGGKPDGSGNIAFGATTAVAIPGTLLDGASSAGTAGQVLTSTGSAIAWGSASTFATSNQGFFYACGIALASAFAYNGSYQAPITNTTANTVVVEQFSLQSSWKLSSVTYQLGTTSSAGSHFNFGIYNAAGSKLIDSGAFDGTSSAIQTLTFTPVTLPPGTYYFAASATDATMKGLMTQTSNSAALLAMLSTSAPYIATAANSTSSNVLPATLGTLTAITTASFWEGIPLCVWKV